MTTLNAHLPSSRRGKPIDHVDFVQAVKKEFEAVYGGKEKAMQIHRVVEHQVKEAKVTEGAKELFSWEWQYGQTPEFTNTIEGDLSIGRVVSRLSSTSNLAETDQSVSVTSRHALITFLSLGLSRPVLQGSFRARQDYLNALALTLVGKRYETLDGAGPPPDSGAHYELGEEVIDWLRRVM